MMYDSYNQFPWKFKMGSLIQKLFKRNLIIYQPEQWSKRLGEQCKHCLKNLTHERCISLCKCYYFCHEDCFKTNFQPQVHSQNTDVQCQKCESDLRMELIAQFKKKACKLTVILLLLILVAVGIVVTLNSDIRVELAFFIFYVEGIILSLILYALVVQIRDIFYKKTVKIGELVSTKLDIQTSAFKDIEMETNQELTKDCLYTAKK